MSAPVTRVLFFGSPYHRLSIAALAALADTVREVLVADYDPLAASAFATVRRAYAAGGLAETARKAARLAAAKLAPTLRRVGVGSGAVASLDDLCQARGLERVACADPNAADFVSLVRERAFDLIVVANFSRMLGSRLFSSARFGAVNVHPSLLPAYRGAYPIRGVLRDRRGVTGVTIHQIDAGLDTGPILAQRAFEIRASDTEDTVLARACLVARELLPEVVRLLPTGAITPRPQDGARPPSFRARSGAKR